MAGGHATPSAAQDTALLSEGVRAVDDIGLKGRDGNDGRRFCDVVRRARHGALPVGVRAADDVDLTGGGGDDGWRACNADGRARHGASPGGGEVQQ